MISQESPKTNKVMALLEQTKDEKSSRQIWKVTSPNTVDVQMMVSNTNM